jgi:hypothetical protein
MILACGMCGGVVETAAAGGVTLLAWAIAEMIVRYHRWRRK